MGLRKHNKYLLKAKYLKSKVLSVSEFLRTEFGRDVDVDSGNFHIMTKGWRAEKEEMLKEVKDEYIAEQKQIAKDRERKRQENAETIEDVTLIMVQEFLRLAIEKDKDGNTVKIKMSPKGIREFFEMARMEQGKTTLNTSSTIKGGFTLEQFTEQAIKATEEAKLLEHELDHEPTTSGDTIYIPD